MGFTLVIKLHSERKNGIWFSVALNERDRMVACSFSDRSRTEAERAVMSSLPRGRKVTRGLAPTQFTQALFRIFKGKVSHRVGPIDMSHLSEFRRKVYNQLRQIPAGKVTTYGAIAKNLGSRRLARAVGAAVGSNPFPLIVPCHRVIPSSLKIGNFGMGRRDPSEGAYMKRALLRREGVKFSGERVSERSLWHPN